MHQSLALTEKRREDEEEAVRRLFNHREESIIRHIKSKRRRIEFLGFDESLIFGLAAAAMAGIVLGRLWAKHAGGQNARALPY